MRLLPTGGAKCDADTDTDAGAEGEDTGGANESKAGPVTSATVATAAAAAGKVGRPDVGDGVRPPKLPKPAKLAAGNNGVDE